MKRDWILVTGQPGSGKTTAVKKIVELLQSRGVDCRGFYTEEVRDTKGSRIGFDVVTIPAGQRGILARKEGIISEFKTGQYFVDVKSFESLALPSLTLSGVNQISTVFVLDEVGRMELHSTAFRDHVQSMLNEDIRLVGAITAPRYGHRVALCDEIASRDGIQVNNLTKKTRDDTLKALLETIENNWLALNEYRFTTHPNTSSTSFLNSLQMEA